MPKINKIEIITVGDELLRGETQDTHAQYIAASLHDYGMRVGRVHTVADSVGEIQDCVKRAVNHADEILITGGLGPTDDDLTLSAVAQLFEWEMVEDADVLARMRKRFAQFNRPLTDNNLTQAQVPKNAIVYPNQVGTAPAIRCRQGNCFLTFMPGVPRELYYFWDKHVLPAIRERQADTDGFLFKTFRFLGLGESWLETQIRPVIEKYSQAHWSFRAMFPEVQVKITLRGEDQQMLIQTAGQIETGLREQTGLHMFGIDDESMAVVVGKLLAAKQETLAVAESCTGGMLGSWLTDVPGSSEYFLGGIISYANALKETQLGVSHDMLLEHGAVSEPVAKAMAQGARKRLGATYALSITGIAGPDGGTETKPVGTMHFGLATPQQTRHSLMNFKWDRDQNRRLAVMMSLDMLRRYLLEATPK